MPRGTISNVNKKPDFKDFLKLTQRASLPKIHRIKLSKNSLVVLQKRYLKKDSRGRVLETPTDLFRRVARTIASAEKKYPALLPPKIAEEKFFSMLANLEFLPNSPTLMNAGRSLGQLSACFVLPVGDSIKEIFDAVKYTALIHQSGGGTGFSFSKIRPAGDIVSTTSGKASGPVSFMRVFDETTNQIKQGGTRRGANMGILDVTHPDIESFISCKEDGKSFPNFNISVAITEDFIKKVKRNQKYSLINPRTGKTTKKIPARKIFEKITELAWKNGEPGIIFIDRINRANPTPKIGRIESTNPCGEQPLLPYESCNLGSINLTKMVTEKGEIDWKKLSDRIFWAVRFLDNVIDTNIYPLEEIKKMTLANRKIGLGVMGFADLLLLLGIPYDSQKAIKLAEKLMRFISQEGHKASIVLAKERGPFPNFSGSTWEKKGLFMRNATVTTIAPTGTISIIAGVSSGIEPLFAVVMTRKNILDNNELLEINPIFEKIAKARGFYKKEILELVSKNGSVRGIKDIPKDVQRLFVTAHDIAPEQHLKIQAAFQKYTDNAVSKTVNFAKSVDKKDIAKVFFLAYKMKVIKGVTIYRDGSRESQVLNRGQAEVESSTKIKQALSVPPAPEPRPRSEIMRGITRKMDTGCGNLFVTINEDEKGLFEVFCTIGKAGGCAASQNEAIGRLISLALRSGIKPENIEKQLIGIRCHNPFGFGPNRILSCADAIAKAIQKYTKPALFEEKATKVPDNMMPAIKNHGAENKDINIDNGGVGACPDCGCPLEYSEGCATCRVCGFSKCS